MSEVVINFKHEIKLILSEKSFNQIKHELMLKGFKSVTMEDVINTMFTIGIDKLKKGNKPLYRSIKKVLEDGIKTI